MTLLESGGKQRQKIEVKDIEYYNLHKLPQMTLLESGGKHLNSKI